MGYAGISGLAKTVTLKPRKKPLSGRYTKHRRCRDIVPLKLVQLGYKSIVTYYMSAWNLSPRVIIWAPSGSALGHPYNYTHQQIQCTDVTMLQLLHVHVRTHNFVAYHCDTKLHKSINVNIFTECPLAT